MPKLRNPILGKQARQDFAVIAGLSALALIIIFVFRVQDRFPVSEIIPYSLLWLALCFGTFCYRRWRQAGAAGVNLHSGVGSWSWDVVEDNLVWSDEVFQIFGVSRDNFEVTYTNLLKLIHPEDRLYVEESVARSLRDNVDYVIDYRICLPGGEVRVVYEQNEVHFEDGRPIRMIGTATDISERISAEIDLRDRYDLLQSLIDAIPIPVYHKDENGIYEGCNKSF